MEETDKIWSVNLKGSKNKSLCNWENNRSKRKAGQGIQWTKHGSMHILWSNKCRTHMRWCTFGIFKFQPNYFVSLLNRFRPEVAHTAPVNVSERFACMWLPNHTARHKIKLSRWRTWKESDKGHFSLSNMSHFCRATLIKSVERSAINQASELVQCYLGNN